VRLGDLVRRGDISANVDVKPGDVLIIPQGWF
jgi:polysaccharide export outer membrane protein